jgi:c(7)-type cytochrome triheme protein
MIRAVVVLAVASALALLACEAFSADEIGTVKMARKAGAGDPSIAPSIFPHGIHRVAFKCPACHDELFPMKAGATQVTMEMIQDGKACGACHNDSGKTAFASSIANCQRCHR